MDLLLLTLSLCTTLTLLQILGDYDSQIAHLAREMDVIRGDFSDWEKVGSGAQASSGR